ncbi:uncharacterized protein LOC123671472 isoform X1 [Harmonia axyridis]|uniref:uncharacterized protein LOC123671472 isoform X1 n=1 Tax=Harmonia axyridis TaxID=115357 RepID=UPI001E2769E5|nr:uncharacterized protein LOC123671472 isoform X1 [Harmonia axyridis]XP_045461289.1 uncharacterized protein LOC123671472 isoform X1 [Harmonia axyridis]
MKRARVKATICVGKKKKVSSQKLIENQDEKCDSSEQKVNSLNVEQKLAQESQDEQVKPPEMVISNTEFTSKESSKTPIIHQENPNPTEHSNIPIVSKFPSSSTNSVTPEPLKENSIPVINCGLMNRSKIKAVPKLKGRKTCSKSISSEITESKTHFVLTTTQESLNTPCLQESTSNSSAKCSSSENVTSPLNCINSILPLSPSKIKSISALENRHFSGSSDLKDGSETINSGIRTQSVSASNTCLQESTSNSPAKCSLSENVSSPVNYVPPLSPSKICRSKIKVIPVLGNRKHFSSTSDSEDGSKRITSRTRTESQCSNISGIQETTLEQTSILKINEYTAEIKKKCRKTEGSKKLDQKN